MANSASVRGEETGNIRRSHGSGEMKLAGDSAHIQPGDQNGGQSKFPSDFAEWSEDGSSEWREAQQRKRQRANTGGESSKVGLEEFDRLDINDKLSRMMRILSPLEGLEKSMAVLAGKVQSTREEVAELRTNVNGIEERIRYVEYRAIDLESRSRRNNLLFFGIGEKAWEKCEGAVRNVIVEKMGIAGGSDMYIQRAHRLGRVKVGHAVRPRPIIVAFRDYGDIELIMSEVTRLRGSGLGVSRDYPPDINNARSRLSKAFNEAKLANRNPKIVFPAKLIIDGRVARDEFPDWSRILYGRTHSIDTASDIPDRTNQAQSRGAENSSSKVIGSNFGRASPASGVASASRVGSSSLARANQAGGQEKDKSSKDTGSN